MECTSLIQVILSTVVALVIAAPTYIDSVPSTRSAVVDIVEVIPILRDDRVQEPDGTYNYDVETGNGIVLAQSGSPIGQEGAVVKSGSYS